MKPVLSTSKKINAFFITFAFIIGVMISPYTLVILTNFFSRTDIKGIITILTGVLVYDIII
jgi:hypothetical protein